MRSVNAITEQADMQVLVVNDGFGSLCGTTENSREELPHVETKPTV